MISPPFQRRAPGAGARTAPASSTYPELSAPVIDRFLAELPSLHVLVAGDFMLDEYLFGRVERISPEAPVPVLSVEGYEHRLGGAANVVANLRSIGCRVTAAGQIGDDTGGDILRRLLGLISVDDSFLITTTDHPTTHKVRLVAQDHQLVRFDRESLE